MSLSNSSGKVGITQGMSALKILLADLNHEALSMIRPQKINFYFEDNEAFIFYKNIINSIDIDCEKIYKNLTLSCGTYKLLIDQGFEEFFRSVVVLDGDFKSVMPETQNNSLVFLPGTLRPENIAMNFLRELPNDDVFWQNEHFYTKRVFLQNSDGVEDKRDPMKKWFRGEMLYWGLEGERLFNRWKEIYPAEVTAVIERTKAIVSRITDNFYELSTNNQNP